MVKILFFSAFLLLAIQIHSQITVPGIPESFQINEKAGVIIPAKLLDAVDTSKMLADDRDNGITNRYSVLQKIDVNIKDEGIKTEINGEGYIWRYKVSCPDAYSLGILFSSFRLPGGARIFVYNESHSLVAGAFTNMNNNKYNQLTLADFKGNEAIIEYFQPYNPDFESNLIIGSVSRAYKNIFAVMQNLQILDINCYPQHTDWALQKQAVCRMTFYENGNGYYCSGSLINNTKNDGTPFFLTAHHCIDTIPGALSLVCYFNYESAYCNGPIVNSNQTLSGSSLLATYASSDFTLLKLNQVPPANYNPFFEGWDASGRTSKNATGIHHPEGLEKCISISNSSPTTYNQSIDWYDDQGHIQNTTPPNTHWEIIFNQGPVEGGSSGSPIFDDNKRAIGQLHGGDNSGLDNFYGKLSVSWNSGRPYTEQLAHWLDPDNSGALTLDGLAPKLVPVADFSTSLSKICLLYPIKFTDKSQYSNQWIWKVSPSSYSFAAGSDSNSQSPEIIFLTEGFYSITQIALNSNGADTIIKNNFIYAGNNLDVKLSRENSDSSICGYKLKNYLIWATGAPNYIFNIKDSAKIETVSNSDSIYLTLNPLAKKYGSFTTLLKVTGIQGNCRTSDSVTLTVRMSANDDIENAIELKLGPNGPFSNACGTIQGNEPFPGITGCTTQTSWCDDNTGTPIHNTIWFTFKGPSDGSITIDTRGFNDRICVYGADSAGDIISVNNSRYRILAANDDRSDLDNTALISKLIVTSGKTYWLQLDGFQGEEGNCTIELFSNNIELFPNPTTGKFDILISYPKEAIADIYIYSSLGTAVLWNRVYVTNNTPKFSFDGSKLSSGIYYVRVYIDGREFSKKITILK